MSPPEIALAVLFGLMLGGTVGVAVVLVVGSRADRAARRWRVRNHLEPMSEREVADELAPSGHVTVTPARSRDGSAHYPPE